MIHFLKYQVLLIFSVKLQVFLNQLFVMFVLYIKYHMIQLCYILIKFGNILIKFKLLLPLILKLKAKNSELLSLMVVPLLLNVLKWNQN